MAQNSSFFLAIIDVWDEMALDASALSMLIKCEGAWITCCLSDQDTVCGPTNASVTNRLVDLYRDHEAVHFLLALSLWKSGRVVRLLAMAVTGFSFAPGRNVPQLPVAAVSAKSNSLLAAGQSQGDTPA